MEWTEQERRWMRLALDEARAAETRGEVPVGAVLVDDRGMVARAANSVIARNDPTAHAEVLALRRGGRRLGNYRLGRLTLYVTVEPCLMCYGAAVHARLERIVYACDEPKGGVVSGGVHGRVSGLNHRLQLDGGLEADAARRLLVGFFAQRRGRGQQIDGEVPKWP